MSDRPIETGGPTFGSVGDKIVYLLAEYKVPLSIVVAAGLITGSAFPEAPSIIPTPPPELVDFIVPAGILSIPAYIIWKRVAERIVARNHVKVIEYNGPDEDDSVYMVPPTTWKERSTGMLDAHRPQSGDVWKVSEFSWDESTSRIYVEGVWPEAADPADLFESQVRFDKIYSDLISQVLAASAFKSVVGTAAIDMYDQSVAENVILQEKGVLPDGVSASERISDLEDELDDMLDLDSIGELRTDDGGERLDDENIMNEMNEMNEIDTDGTGRNHE